MKPFQLILLLLLLGSTTAQADPATDYRFDYEAVDVLADVVIVRPLSLAGTIAATGLFIGLSPLTALASIPYPYDAFSRVADILLVKPASFTFVRPVGKYCIDGRIGYGDKPCYW